MKIRLAEWGERNYSPAPSRETLKRWARNGELHPEPERVGHKLMVDECAVRIPVRHYDNVESLSTRFQEILRSA